MKIPWAINNFAQKYKVKLLSFQLEEQAENMYVGD